jgi:hypothetical protein
MHNERKVYFSIMSVHHQCILLGALSVSLYALQSVHTFYFWYDLFILLAFDTKVLVVYKSALLYKMEFKKYGLLFCPTKQSLKLSSPGIKTINMNRMYSL